MTETIIIRQYEEGDLKPLSIFLQEHPNALFYYSLDYRDLLVDYLSSESINFLALNESREVLAYFPLMLSKNKGLGIVANSLPFYGSNGGVLVNQKLNETQKELIKNRIFEAVEEFCFSKNIKGLTVISNPFEPEESKWLEENFRFDFKDYRIGQITNINGLDEESLLKKIDNPRPRNIRKAKKSGIEVYSSNAKEDMDFLYEVHRANILAINGIPKEKSFFDKIFSKIPENLFKIYIATLNGKKVSGLLLFYYKNTIEYFTPATIHDYRNLQPSSLLIYQAMLDGAADGYSYFNWGGTWKSQHGVFNFKKKWGADEYHYQYYIRLFDNSLLKATPEELLQGFPNFYVLPFSELISA